MEGEVRAAKLAELREEWSGCRQCNLHETRSQIVHGGGSIGEPGRPPIMLVGQAPGGREDAVGKPFIGMAGELLMETLLHLYETSVPEIEELIPKRKNEAMNFPALRKQLERFLYFTNIALCWPPEDRPPATAEIKACRPRLEREIYLLDPPLIIALGKVAIMGLTKYKGSVDNARGSIMEIEIPGEVMPVRYPVFCTYHPSFIARMGDWDKKDGYFTTWYRDLETALGIVDRIHNRLLGDDIPKRR